MAGPAAHEPSGPPSVAGDGGPADPHRAPRGAARDHVLAVDVGATKLSAGIVTHAGEVVARADAPTGGVGDAEALFAALLDAVARVREAAPAAVGDPLACGVGCAGPLGEHGEVVSPLNLPVWREFPLRRRLADATGLPTHVDLDAKALALGEGWIGAARGVRDYLAMVVSTGVGGGLVLDGRLLDGASGNAGHIGHVIVEPDGRACACGARGCLEAEASGPAIAARSGRPPEQADRATVARAGRLVGRAVASVANLLDLQLAVVAGSVALGFGRPFFDAAQAELGRSCRLAFSAHARIVPAGLGASGPLVGAAAVGLRGIAESRPAGASSPAREPS